MRVLLVDDQVSVRSALRLLLENEHGMEIVGEASGVQDLLGETRRLKPEVLLLDWELPGMPPQSVLISTLRLLSPDVRIVTLSGNPEVRGKALADGADAFVSKGDPPEELLASLNAPDKSVMNRSD